jgi:hypothetical protein
MSKIILKLYHKKSALDQGNTTKHGNVRQPPGCVPGEKLTGEMGRRGEKIGGAK